MPIDEASAKVRTGPPVDDAEDPRRRCLGGHAAAAHRGRHPLAGARPEARGRPHPLTWRSSDAHERAGTDRPDPRPPAPRAGRLRTGARHRDRRRGPVLPPRLDRRRRRPARDPHDPRPHRGHALRPRLLGVVDAPDREDGTAGRDRDHPRRRDPVRPLDVRALDELPDRRRLRDGRGGHRRRRARPGLRRDHRPRRARPRGRGAPPEPRRAPPDDLHQGPTRRGEREGERGVPRGARRRRGAARVGRHPAPAE